MSRAGEGLYQRGNVWHFKYRDPQTRVWRERTTGKTLKRDAFKVKQEFLTDMEAGTLPNDMSVWTLKAAIEDFCDYRQATIAPKTARMERSFLRVLVNVRDKEDKPVLAEASVLNTLTPRDLEKYQVARRKAGKHPRTVNLELKTLRQVLKRANLWQRFAAHYKELKVPATQTGKVLSPEHAKKLLKAAQENPEWQLAFYCAALAGSTGLRCIEIRRLQLQDVVIDGPNPHLDIRRSKTDAGVRYVPLNSGGVVAAKWLLDRAKTIGASEPTHYLLPINRSKHTRDYDPNKGRRGYDPTTPMGGWGKSWRKLRTAAGVNYRFHDMRHTFITLCATRNVPVAVTKSLVGHRSEVVTAIYTHIQQSAQQQAVHAIDADLSFIGAQ